MSLPVLKPELPPVPLRDAPAVDAGCTNCGAALQGAWCSQCGEKQPDATDWSLGGLAREALNTFTNVDGTLWRTLVTLVRRPGMLTAEYFAGRKSRYMRPMALFIALNVAFFFIQPRVGLFNWRYDTFARTPTRMARMEARRAELGWTSAQFRERFDASLNAKKQSMLLVEIPLFALAVAAVQLRRRRPLAQHMVFAIHAYAFFALYLSVFLVGFILTFELLIALARAAHLGAVAAAVSVVGRTLGSEAGIDTMLAGGLAAWLVLAVRRVYGEGWARAVVGAVLLLAAVLTMISFQSLPVFELTLRML